ncbi:MAG: rod shape-determining protein MreC [bacterium]
MRLFHDLFIKQKEYLTLLAAVVLSLALIFSNDGHQIRSIKTWALGGFGFMLEKASVVSRFNAIYQENRWLRQQNAQLMIENSKLREARFENDRLKQLLDFKSESQLDLVPAKVIGAGHNGFIKSVIITAGNKDSLVKNMAVVTSQGLVGKLFSVGQRHSVAQLLLDRNFRVSAMIQRSRVTGIIEWQQGEHVILSGVFKRADVKVGDLVTTSGYSSIFPAGLIIGHVAECTKDERELFLNIVVQPSVDISKLEEVFVIRTRQN